jgi:hypothetical protein
LLMCWVPAKHFISALLPLTQATFFKAASASASMYSTTIASLRQISQPLFAILF